MPTGHNTPETSGPAPKTVAAHGTAHRTGTAHPSTGAAHDDGEAALRDWEGLPPETSILIPTYTTPMNQPNHAWALLVQAVDITGDLDLGEELELFAGTWLANQPPADLVDGDLVVRITPLDDTVVAVDLDMLLACYGRWHRVGSWLHLGTAWPATLAPTAATVMGFYTGLIESTARQDTGPATGPPHGALRALLDAGLVRPGEEFLWERRNTSVRHTARIQADGTLTRTDGQVFATPTGAATTLCGYDQNGWGVFRRTSDGRTLGDLRTDLRARRGH